MGLRDFRGPLDTPHQILFRFGKSPQIRQDLGACQQRRRMLRIPAMGFIQVLQCAMLVVQVAQLGGTDDQQRNGQLAREANSAKHLMQGGSFVERPQSRQQFGDNTMRKPTGVGGSQCMETGSAITPEQRLYVGQLDQHIGILRVSGSELTQKGVRPLKLASREQARRLSPRIRGWHLHPGMLQKKAAAGRRPPVSQGVSN
jgi:hypothetical protein